MQIKKVLVIGGNYDQVPYIKELKRRGYYIYLTDINPAAPGISYSDEFFEIGYNNIEQIKKISKKINLTSNDKVFTASAQFSHIAASVVAENSNIIYPKKEIIEMCLDKCLFYDSFNRSNLPVPKYYKINSNEELKKILNNFNESKCFYLKSDLSKNPNYIYKITKKNFTEKKIFWGKDRYLKNYYILQEEFVGKHLRLNMYSKNFIIFDFFSGEIDFKEKKFFIELNIIENLYKFLKKNQLSSWLVKFDIIRSNDKWCVLDIGIDPPMRMKNYYKKNNEDFYFHYINHYINNNFSYPIKY